MAKQSDTVALQSPASIRCGEASAQFLDDASTFMHADCISWNPVGGAGHMAEQATMTVTVTVRGSNCTILYEFALRLLPLWMIWDMPVDARGER